MNCYLYDGPVVEFNTCISNRWRETTYAKSEKQAKSNLLYRYKKQNGKLSTAKIDLPGKVVVVG